MKQPKQDIRAEDEIRPRALSSQGRIDTGHEPQRVYDLGNAR